MWFARGSKESILDGSISVYLGLPDTSLKSSFWSILIHRQHVRSSCSVTWCRRSSLWRWFMRSRSWIRHWVWRRRCIGRRGSELAAAAVPRARLRTDRRRRGASGVMDAGERICGRIRTRRQRIPQRSRGRCWCRAARISLGSRVVVGVFCVTGILCTSTVLDRVFF